MTDQVVGVTNQPAGAGVSLVDVSEMTVNGKTAERQRVAIGDPTIPGRMVGVSAAGGMQVDSAVGAANFLGGQTAMTGTAAVQVAAARTGAPGTGRISITVNNLLGVTIYLGATSGVTASNGMPLPAGEAITLQTTSAIYAVLAGAGTSSIGFCELY